MLEKDLGKYSKLFAQYTELRFQENKTTRIVFLNGNLVANEKSAMGGVSARVCKNDAWGFASNPERSEEAAKSVIRAAAENSAFLDSRLKRPGTAFPCVSASSENSHATTKSRKSQKEYVDFIKGIDSHIAEKYKDLKSRTVVLSALDMEKSLITVDGSRSYSMIPRTILVIVLSSEKDSTPVELYEVYGGLGQFEDVFDGNFQSYIFPEIEKLHEHLMKKTESVFPNAGNRECILDADLAGILAHEAIGHTTEADLVRGGSVATDFMNKEVASPLVTLIDFANTAFGKVCPVPVYIDDEGTRGQDATIIEKGVLKSYLHNKETAHHFKTVPTGNARAYQFSDEPIIRMRNTAILPGTSKLDDMIASIKDGYYLMKTGNGQADSTSEFMFGITLGYEITNGKLGRAIKDTTISGLAFEVLKTVSMVSDDMKWSCGGMCGKKQLIPVGMGGPAIKCRVNIGGK